MPCLVVPTNGEFRSHGLGQHHAYGSKIELYYNNNTARARIYELQISRRILTSVPIPYAAA